VASAQGRTLGRDRRRAAWPRWCWYWVCPSGRTDWT